MRKIVIKTVHENLASFRKDHKLSDKEIASVRKAVKAEWSEHTMIDYFKGLGKDNKQANRIYQFAKNEVENKIANNKNVKD